MRVVVQGRLKQRSYEDREGVKRTVYELDVEEVGPSLTQRHGQGHQDHRSRWPGGPGGGAAAASRAAATGAAAPVAAASRAAAVHPPTIRGPPARRPAAVGGSRAVEAAGAELRRFRRLRSRSGGGYSDEPPF